MADSTRPLLIFPRPELVATPPGRGVGSPPPKPIDSSERNNRILQRFQQAVNHIQDAPGDPNKVLVIETVGKFQNFHDAVSKIDGLEWMAEFDVDDVNLDEMYVPDSDNYEKAKKQGGRWYLSSSNKQALEDILRLYKHWQDTGEVEYSFGGWKNVFIYITDLRFWNAKDRLEYTGILEQWKKDVKSKSGTDSICDFEVELHYRKQEDDADSAKKELIKHIQELKGQVGNIYRNGGIAFHAIKVTLPVSAVEHILDAHHQQKIAYPKWIQLDSIKYCRPIGQQLQEDIEPEATVDLTIEAPKPNPPVVALLDGAPFTRHKLIEDLIVLDDPDGFADKYEPAQQKHGTAMASLICHNDLSDLGRTIIQRAIYVRPIMYPNDAPQPLEQIPQTEFAEDLIERALVRMIDGEGDSEPVCPSVKIINLSVGNLDQPFVREMSAWARLLDWLSWKYKVLFIVSAGNYRSAQIPVSDQSKVVTEFIQEIQKTQHDRKLLSPAESVNSLTVGAIQHDHSPPGVDGLKNPYDNQRLPAEYSRNGPGFRSQIKPEILVPGGKQLYENNHGQWVPQDRKEIGQKVASVGLRPEETAYSTHTIGTSNAAAITTHAAAHLYEIIAALEREGEQIPEAHYALVLKSLLVHGASWRRMDEQYSILRNPQNSRRLKRVYANHLGYGEANFERVMSCTKRRVTLIGFGELSEKERHRFQLSIPDPLGGLHIRLIATLAWFTPINPFRYGYRQAKLFFKIPDYSSDGSRQNADWQQVNKGTVQHEVFELNNFGGDRVEIFVQCGADAIEDLEEKIPYAISFTIEIVQEQEIEIDLFASEIDLYAEISQSIKVRIE